MAQMTSIRSSSVVRMTMADMAELADSSGSAIRLENADTYLSPPDHVIAATREAVGEDYYNSYLPLDGFHELRQAISERYVADADLHFDPDGEIVVTSGCGEAMLNALLALVNPGDHVLLTNPTYSGMAQRTRLVGGIQRFTHLQEDLSWHLDEMSLREAAAGCKVIFYASPSMPTGAVFTRAETELIADVACENNAVVVFNAAAEKLTYDGGVTVTPATLPGMRDRTVIVGSLSKHYRMPGWRIGWIAGPRALVSPMRDIHIFNGIMPSGMNQAGAVAALAGPQDWVEETASIYQGNRDVLMSRLKDIDGIRVDGCEGGVCFLANVRGLGVSAQEFAEGLLASQDVAVTPMMAWGADEFGRDHVRFIFSNEPKEKLNEAADRVETFVAGSCGRG